MATERDNIKKERIWNDPPLVSENSLKITSKDEYFEVIASQMKKDTGAIAPTLKLIYNYNKKSKYYLLGFMCICIAVMVYFTPLLFPELTFKDIAVNLIAVGIIWILMALSVR